MSDYNDLLDILKHLLINRFAPKPSFTRGLLGDGQGNVEVPGRPDKSYVRFNRGSTEYFEVFNRTVNPVNDWPVLIGELPWQPGLTQIVDTDWAAFEQSGWGDSIGDTSPHAPTHEWPDGSPGSDPVNVHLRSIVPLRAYALTGTTVYVNSLEYEYQGSGHVWGGLPGVDLSPIISDTVTGTMRYAGVYLEPTSNSLAVVTGSTTVHSSALTPPLVSFPAGVVPAGRIKIYGNQATINEADIVDARRPFNPMVTGTSSAGGGGGAWPDDDEAKIGETAYATISLAIAAAAAGDEIRIGAGTYTEQLTINKNLTLVAADDSTVIVTNATSPTVSVTNSSTVVLRNIQVRQTGTAAGAMDAVNVAAGSTLTGIRCLFDADCNGAGSAYGMENSGTVILRNCRVLADNATSASIYGISNTNILTLDNTEITTADTGGGGNSIALFVADPTTIRGGLLNGATYDLSVDTGKTITMLYPELVNDTINNSGTIKGWYFDGDGNLISAGGLIDLNGLADGIVLDADGDTTISAPTDDTIDFEVGGTDRVEISDIGIVITDRILQSDFPLDPPLYNTPSDPLADHYRDNAGVPSTLAAIDAADAANTSATYSMFFLRGTSANTSWKYRGQAALDLEVDLNNFPRFVWGPMWWLDGAFTADVSYYFWICRDNAGIDESSFCRIELNWDSAGTQWRVRSQASDVTSGTLVSGAWTNLNQPLVYPIWIGMQVSKTTMTVEGRIMHAWLDSRLTFSSAVLATATPINVETYGDFFMQMSMSRGAGVNDQIKIGAFDIDG